MAPGHMAEAFHAHDYAQVRVGDDYHYHLSGLASALPRVPPAPSAAIPFRRDCDFVHRSVMDELWQCASVPGARVGLVGLGGTGKSQLAIEHAYRVRETLPQTWVFWVHASSVTRFQESYRRIAEQLQLAGWSDPEVDVLGLVHTWLSDESHGSWRMILDNADSPEVMFGSDDSQAAGASIGSEGDWSCSQYLPVSSNGSIIITSRMREVAQGLDIREEDILKVGPMETEVAARLLDKKLTTATREDDTELRAQLVRELDRIALAITQAAAYVNRRSPRMTVGRYLDMLRHGDNDRVTLLEKGVRDPRRDGKASNSIITAWYITFEHLRRTHASAARLLALMSMFDREAIPDHLLQGHYTGGAVKGVDLEDDVAILRSYSLIHMGIDEHVFDMHRLVQFSTKAWLAQKGELGEWQERYTRILGDAFPLGEHANWTVCKALFPHVEAIQSYNLSGEDVQQVWARVLYNGGWYARAVGRYSTALEMAELSLRMRERVAGEEMKFNSIELLAGVLESQGKYEQAEAMNRRALVGREQVLGADHPDTLTSVYCLANLLDVLQQSSLAQDLYDRAVTGYRRVLGNDHPTTRACLQHQASLLRRAGQKEGSVAGIS